MTRPAAAGSLVWVEKKSSFDFQFKIITLLVYAEMNEQLADGKVYEGGFEDKGDALEIL